MKRIYFLLILLLLGLLAACQPTVPVEDETPTETATEDGGIFPRATLTPADPAGYPLTEPTAVLEEDSYPGLVLEPTKEAYPAADDFVWMILPVGVQCEEGQVYESLTAATDALSDAGIEIKDAATMDLAVCSACGCPTSEHYRVQVAAASVSEAEAMGWTAELGNQ